MADCRPTPSLSQILHDIVDDTRVVPQRRLPLDSGRLPAAGPFPLFENGVSEGRRARPKPSAAPAARGRRVGGTTLERST